ncbi:hypothetical protein K474DRAFT_1669226 [Panus rudis PR-1116 ss-1]|nr:hypothetical protein K474DRAFT_1669226 [Panus rudis PR-1116 ss-1]
MPPPAHIPSRSQSSLSLSSQGAGMSVPNSLSGSASSMSTDLLPIPAAKSRTGPRKKGVGGRDFEADIRSIYSNDEELRAATASFKGIYIRPLRPATQKYHDYVKRLWLTWFTKSKGSEELARATLAPNAPFPNVEEVIQFIHAVTTTGKTHASFKRTVRGWSFHRACLLVGTISSMRRNLGACPAEYADRVNMRNYVRKLAFVDKVLHTQKLPKRHMREEDYVKFLAIALDVSIPFPSNWARLTTMSIGGILYNQGQRLGSLVLRDRTYEKEFVTCGCGVLDYSISSQLWT